MTAFYRTEPLQNCIDLAKGDHKAGALLFMVHRRAHFGKAAVPGRPGRWSRNPASMWARAARLSEDQYSRAMRKLDTLGLIERAHTWHGNRSVLHVRLSEHAQAYLAMAKTARMVRELAGESGPISVLLDLWAKERGEPPAAEQAGELALQFEALGTVHAKWHQVDLRPHAPTILSLGLRHSKAADVEDVVKAGLEEWEKRKCPTLHPDIEVSDPEEA